MSADRLCIIGPAHRVAIMGALIARRWAGNGRAVTLQPTGSDDLAKDIIARPDHMRFHSDLGLHPDEVAKATSARAQLAPVFARAGGTASLPYAAIAPAANGVDFHHYWMRCNTIEKQPDLFGFSTAIAVQDSMRSPDISALVQAGVPFGMTVDARRYSDLLLKVAAQNGASVSGQPAAQLDAFDCVIDCQRAVEPNREKVGWGEQRVSLAFFDELPGLEWQVCYNAASRFVNLASVFGNASAERQEYTRLAQQERDRIADMAALLCSPQPAQTDRPALRRKIDVFSACGRIPTEDFEVFGQSEWLAALWARGIRPRRYNRMAQIMPEAQLTAWMRDLYRKAQAVTHMAEQAGGRA